MNITREIAAKVLSVVDAGLVSGLGKPIPGQMCVEAAVCFALGEPHGDKARAKGLRQLALAQLGSANALDEKEFVRRVVDYALRVSAPQALRAAASIQKDHEHKAALLDAAARCKKEGSRAAAIEARKAATYATYAAASAARAATAAAAADAAAAYATYDKSLAAYAKAVVQILIEMNAPGCQWLGLAEAA